MSDEEIQRWIEDDIVDVLRGTVLSLESLFLGYYDIYFERERIERAIKRLKRQRRVVSSRRGYYELP